MKKIVGLLMFCLIFAFPFIGFGLLATSELVEMVSGWQSARGWVAVKAQVLQADLEAEAGRRATTYEAQTRYAYRYEGKTYESSRLGVARGGDNIGDWQRVQHRILRDALEKGTPVTVWVNPSQPSQAVFNRDLRVGQVLFMLPFATLFTLIGLGALWGVWWTIRSKPEGEPRANPPRISSDERVGQWIVFGIVLFWNLLTFPLGALLLIERGLWGEHLAVLIFPLIGIALTRWWAQDVRDSHRIGRMTLTLAPGQPAVGRPLSARIEFEKPPGGGIYTLRLMNEEINEGRKHQDTRLLWEQEWRVREAGGVLTCQFDPPVTSRASGLNGRLRTAWRLNLVWPDGKISRNFPLTVLPSQSGVPGPAGPEAGTHLPEVTQTREKLPTAPLAEPAELPASLATLTPLDGGLRIDFSARRHRDTARAFIVVGAVFVMFTAFMLTRSGGGLELIFGMVGLGLLVAGARLWTSPLRVEVTGHSLRVRGRSPFKQVSEQWPSASVQRIVPVATSSGGAGHGSQYSYALMAEFTGGSKITVGDGIRSRAVADMLAKRIQDALGK